MTCQNFTKKIKEWKHSAYMQILKFRIVTPKNIGLALTTYIKTYNQEHTRCKRKRKKMSYIWRWEILRERMPFDWPIDVESGALHNVGTTKTERTTSAERGLINTLVLAMNESESNA